MADNGEAFPRIEGLEVRGLLGRGVTSSVYLATQTKFSRPVALKVLETDGMPAGPLELLADEARFTALLSAHPNIVTLYDAGVTSDGCTYLVTEYLPAGSLAQRIRSEGPLGMAEVLQIGILVAGALESSHLHGVVHGDVKPDNLLIGRSGQPQLADFGVAVMQSRSAVAEQALITPLHAAPELFSGSPASVPADIYSLGSTLVELLCGHSPVGSREEASATIVSRVERSDRLACEVDGADGELLALLATMTAEDPAGRPTSAAEVGRALMDIERRCCDERTRMLVIEDLLGGTDEAALTDEPTGAATTVPPPGSGVQAEAHGTDPPERSGRSATLAWAGTGVLLVLIALTAVLLLRSQSGGSEQGSADGSVDTGQDPEGEDPGDELPERSDEVPEGSVAGIQPGIRFHPDGTDTSAELAETLADEQVIFGSVPAEVSDVPHYGIVLSSLPATFHYQGYNSLQPHLCRGMMSRELTVEGLWERSAIWPGGVLLVAVAETVDEETAYEMATVLSVELGVESEDCRGFGGFNVRDYSDYAVEHRDVEDMLPAGVDYNVWVEHDLEVGANVWGETVRLVMPVDHYVVDVSLATNSPVPAGNVQLVSAVANQLRARLRAADGATD